MKTQSRAILTAMAVSLVLSGAVIGARQPKRDPAVLLERAIQVETVDGDLEAAIEQYRQIIADNGNHRTIAAKAMLRLGGCYEKLGQEEARRVYERLISEYPDQSQETEVARQRLARLVVSAADHVPQFRRIHVPVGMSLSGSGMLSPDGQKLAFISQGSLWVVPVHGKSHPNIAGTPIRLTESMHAWDAGNVSIAWSGNGEWIGFRVAVPKEDENAVEELYLVPAKGGDPIRLPILWHNWADNAHTLRYALSWDSENLFFVDGASYEDLKIYRMPSMGGQWQAITEPTTREPALSPDGSKIAYVRMLQNSERDPYDRQEVWVKSLSGGESNLISRISDDGWLVSPIWSPDGSMIAFLCSSGRGGNRYHQVWIVPLSPDGRPVASPTQFDLPGQTSDLLAGWTVDNKIGILIPSPMSSPLYTVPASGGKATQLTPKHAYMPFWSPDGKSIYFDGTHGGKLASIEVVPAEGGEVERIPMEPKFLHPHYPHGGISVSPVGSSILFAGFSARSKVQSGLFTIPIEGGKASRLIGSQSGDREPTWSPDGRSLAFIRPEQNTDGVWLWNIFVMSLLGGEPHRITQDQDAVQMSSIRWSPDGELIAFRGQDHSLRFIPIDGGPSRVLIEKPGGAPRWQGITWFPDGKMLAYSAGNNLWKIAREGGDPIRIETGLDNRIGKIDWSPDGERIAFVAFEGGVHELWLMEDFLPLVKTER